MSQHSPSINYNFERLIARIPPDIAVTFTDTQLKALRYACTQLVWKKHSVDIRLSIPFLGKGCYLVFLAGKEQRSRERLRAEHLAATYSYSTLISVAVSSMVFGLILAIGLLPTAHSAIVFLSQQRIHSTAIPALQNQNDCLEAGQVWKDDVCWDQPRDP